MNGLFAAVLNMSITAGVVMGFVLPVRLMLKKAPRIFSYILWSVVLFRLLCPVSFQVGYSVLELGDIPAAPVGEQASTVAFIPEELVFPGQEWKEIPQELPREENTARPGTQLPAIVWLVGAASMELWGLWSWLRLRKQLRESAPVAPGVREADGLQSAFVLGIFRPRIFIPGGLTARQREYVLLHEHHHIRRLDHVWKALGFLALCVHWFNPLVWLAFFLAERDMETSCDEAVAAKLSGNSRCDYARTLMEISGGKRRVAAMPLGFGDGNVKERVVHVIKWKRSPLWVKCVCLMLCTVLLAACGGNPGAETTLSVGGEEQKETISPEQAEQDRLALEGELDGLRQEADRTRPTDPVTVLPYAIGVQMKLTEYANMALSLPSGWAYTLVEYEGTDRPCGIRFWPKECPGAAAGLYYHPGGFGVCGTGLITTEMETDNGQTVILGYYDRDEFLSFCSYWGDYAAISEGIENFPEYEDELVAILQSVVLNQGCASETEALAQIQKAGLVQDGWDVYRAVYDIETGQWTFEFYDGGEVTQTICVSHDGTCTHAGEHHSRSGHHHD